MAKKRIVKRKNDWLRQAAYDYEGSDYSLMYGGIGLLILGILGAPLAIFLFLTLVLGLEGRTLEIALVGTGIAGFLWLLNYSTKPKEDAICRECGEAFFSDELWAIPVTSQEYSQEYLWPHYCTDCLEDTIYYELEVRGLDPGLVYCAEVGDVPAEVPRGYYNIYHSQWGIYRNIVYWLAYYDEVYV